MPLDCLIKTKQNYITIKRKTLAMVYVLQKFKHFLLGYKFVFYVDHMALVYLVSKPHMLGRITRRLLLFLEYEFTIVYKLDRTHVVANVLSRLLNNLEQLGLISYCGCIIIFFRTYMDVKSKNLSRDMLDAKNFKPNSKIEVG